MSKINITIENVHAAYKVADENGKKLLKALFNEEEPKIPTLDDYTTIRTYEDACEALGEEPMNIEVLTSSGVPPHIIALMKLETISRALWGKTFQPEPDASGDKIYYWVWSALYTQAEIDRMDEDDKGALLAGRSHNGAGAGFGCLLTNYRSSYSSAHVGFRLCQETSEKAKYFGRTFTRLWAEYHMFNFTVEL